jgi:hypothetical protein
MLGDTHGPDLVVIAGTVVAGPEGIWQRMPGEAIGADDVLDSVVIREGEVEEMEFVAMGEDFDVADFREAEAPRGVHGGSPVRWLRLSGRFPARIRGISGGGNLVGLVKFGSWRSDPSTSLRSARDDRERSEKIGRA